MAKLKLIIELDYDADIMHEDDLDATRWFFEVITKDLLILNSREIGDDIGTVKVLEVRKDDIQILEIIK